VSETALPHLPLLGSLVAPGGLQRGTVVGIGGRAGIASLTLSLLAETLGQGCWGAVVSWPELGAEAALELGVPLDHLALIPEPGPKWLDVVGALVDSVDLVVLRPSGRVNVSVARRIAARARERGCVVVVTLFGSTQWPESFDARFVATSTNWVGLGRGFGTVRQRFLDVEVDGRRVPNKRRTQLVLPPTAGDAAQVPAAAVSESDDGDGFAITA
jgi:hypothetical protein